MAASKPTLEKRYFTVAEANATLPLVRAIVRDIMELARDLRDRQGRLNRFQAVAQKPANDAYQEEIDHARADFERDQERLHDYEHELRNLGVELKDYFIGLIDFPCLMDDREVYLCWKAGEPEVGFWHDLEAGFAGRQRIPVTTVSKN
jgi:hypothetical protein